MKYQTLGIIGSGNHFNNKIKPVLKKNKFFKISGYLKRKNLKKNYFTEKEFFKKKFDFVYISCPNELHEKYIVKALNSGFNVICEKPFLTKSNNLKKIIQLSKKKNKLIFECFMYVYHPVFSYIKALIESKKLGPIQYVISSFKFPSLEKNNNRYSKKLGNGFFYDAAVYPLSLENYLFNFKSKLNVTQKTFKNTVDLNGYILLENKSTRRFYFWGEGQNYSNNLEIFFKKGSLYVDKFFSKPPKKSIFVKIQLNKKEIIKKFKPSDHFENMFKVIEKKYKSKSFLKKNRELISNHYNLLDLVKSS